MKKYAFLFLAAFCLPVLGLTGCGGDSGTKVIEVQEEIEPEISEDEQAEFDAAMDADSADPGN